MAGLLGNCLGSSPDAGGKAPGVGG